MKNIKKLLLVAVAALTFVACSDNNDDKKDEQKTVQELNVSDWNGTLTVDAGNFSMDNVEMETTCKTSAKTCNILLKQVTFSEKMPMKMDCQINGITFSVSNGDTTLTGTNPKFLATLAGNTGSYGYSVKSVTGVISNGRIELSTVVTSERGDMIMGFSGARK